MRTLVAAAEPPARNPAPFAGRSMSLTATGSAVAIDIVGRVSWPLPDQLLRPTGGAWTAAANPEHPDNGPGGEARGGTWHWPERVE